MAQTYNDVLNQTFSQPFDRPNAHAISVFPPRRGTPGLSGPCRPAILKKHLLVADAFPFPQTATTPIAGFQTAGCSRLLNLEPLPASLSPQV